MSMFVEWQQYESGGRLVEGQFFRPQVDNDELILFCPGFTGAGATLFEQRHVATLVHEGYSVLVLRHNGTRLDTPGSAFLVNNARRLGTARKQDQKYLGGGPGAVSDWLLEPLAALDVVWRAFSRIHVFGSSFGVLSAFWSLSRPEAPIERIASVVCLAGMQGLHDDSAESVMRIWTREFVGDTRLARCITLDGIENTISTISEAYKELPYCVRSLPERIAITYVVAAEDELVSLRDTERFIDATGGRGHLVIDSIDRAHPVHGLLAHDMPDYPTEYLIDLIVTSHR